MHFGYHERDVTEFRASLYGLSRLEQVSYFEHVLQSLFNMYPFGYYLLGPTCNPLKCGCVVEKSNRIRIVHLRAVEKADACNGSSSPQVLGQHSQEKSWLIKVSNRSLPASKTLRVTHSLWANNCFAWSPPPHKVLKDDAKEVGKLHHNNRNKTKNKTNENDLGPQVFLLSKSSHSCFQCDWIFLASCVERL